MSTDLLTQLADYGRFHDEAQAAVGVDEVFELVGPPGLKEAPPSTVGRWRRLRVGRVQGRVPAWVYALAVGVLVALMIGGVAWVNRDAPNVEPIDTSETTAPSSTTLPTSDDGTQTGLVGPGRWSLVASVEGSSDPGSELEAVVARVNDWDGVVDVRPVEDSAAWAEVTGVPCPFETVESSCPQGFAALVLDAWVQTTALRLESEMGLISRSAAEMEQAFLAGYLDRAFAVASPAPSRFDQSTLGEEQALAGPDRAAECGGRAVCEVAVTVSVDGIDIRAGVVLSPPDDMPGPLLLVSDDGERSWSGIELGSLPIDWQGRGGVLASLRESVESRRIYALAGLPLDAAVVTVETSGQVLWQRPLAGMALLIGPEGSFIADGSEGAPIPTPAAAVIEVLDADGAPIIRIEDTSSEPRVDDLRIQAAMGAVMEEPQRQGTGNPPAPDGMALVGPRMHGFTDFVASDDALWVGMQEVVEEPPSRGFVARVDRQTGVVTDVIELIDRPKWLVPTSAGLWVISGDERTLRLIDYETREIATEMVIDQGGGTPYDAFVEDGAMWVAYPKGVARVDLDDLTVDFIPGSLATTFSGSWLGEHGGVWWFGDLDWGGLYRFDVQTQRIERMQPDVNPNHEVYPTFAGDSIWYVVCCAAEAYRFDLDTYETTRIPLDAIHFFGVADDSGVWLASERDSIDRLDANTGELTDSLPIGGAPKLIDGESLWVAAEGSLARIDLRSRTIMETFDVPGASPWESEFIAADGIIWVATRDGTVTRIDTG